jgi:hypothetical protein
MKLGAQAHPALESAGAGGAADRYVVEITGGVATLTIVATR